MVGDAVVKIYWTDVVRRMVNGDKINDCQGKEPHDSRTIETNTMHTTVLAIV